MTIDTTTNSRSASASLGGDSATRRLLVCGVIAGPLFIVASLVQALARPGFNITKNEISLLSLGSSAGWIQVLNFLITGALFIAAAFGFRKVFSSGPGSRWVPRLLGAIGVGMAAGGIFRVDPSTGYPIGTPAGASATANWHGLLHTVCGSLAFLALVVLCFVLARRFSATGQRGWAVGSRIVGVLCAVGIASGGATTLALFVGVGAAMFWIALVSLHLAVGPTPIAGQTKGS